MDIEYESTPPKKTNRNPQFSTPNRKTTPKDTDTPRKNKNGFQSPQPKHPKNIFQSPQPSSGKHPHSNILSTPPKRHQNPESKKPTKHSSRNLQTPYKSPVQDLQQQASITPFYLPRIESDYKFLRTLGHGNFSQVSLYESRLTKQPFAIKVTSMSLMSVNQVQALGTLAMFSEKSRNIVKYYCSWIEDETIYIVMEFCEASVKSMYLQAKKEGSSMAQDKLKEILKQALIGLRCMHEHNMVHLDIKPDNLLIKDGEVKIADLGLCRITRIKRWTDLDQGDSRYLAREVLNYNQGVDLKKSDIYSLGMSIFQGALLEDLPNNGQEWLRIREQGINFKEIPQMSSYSAQFIEILAMMLQPNWSSRPSCEQLLGHKYFSQQPKNKRLSRFMRGTGQSSRKMEGSL